MPTLAIPDFFAPLRELFDAVRDLLARINSESEEKRQRARQIAKLLDSLQHLVENSSDLERVFLQECTDPLILQIQLMMDYMLRDIQSMLTIISLSKKKLPSKIYKRLKRYINSLSDLTSTIDKKLLERDKDISTNATLVYKIDKYKLLTPLRFFVEDDDSGKYVSCLELPQVYGFGETEDEAMAMLTREILSLREDVKSSESVSEEYTIASQLIDMAFSHHG